MEHINVVLSTIIPHGLISLSFSSPSLSLSSYIFMTTLNRKLILKLFRVLTEIVEKKNTTIIDINLLILDVQVFREKSLLKLKVKQAKIILLMLLGDAHPAVHRIPSVQKYFGTFPQT